MATSSYDAKKAAEYNKLRQQGLSDEAAFKQSGITDAEADNYVVNDAKYNSDGSLNTNRGQIGPVVFGSGTISQTPTAAEQKESAQFYKGLESNNFERVDYPVKADSQPSNKTPITYTTTSTEQVSGGGSTTITAGQFKENAATRSLQPEIDAKQAELTQSYKDYPVSNRGREKAGLPLLTPDELQANQERATAISKEKVALQYKQQDAGTPSEPTVTTVPNTTTTETTVTTGTTVTNSGLNNVTEIQTPGGADAGLNAQAETQIANNTVSAGSIESVPAAAQDPYVKSVAFNQGAAEAAAPAEDPYPNAGAGRGFVNPPLVEPDPQQIETFRPGESTITAVEQAPGETYYESGGGGGNQGTITRVSTEATDVDTATDPAATGGGQSTISGARGGNTEENAAAAAATQEAATKLRAQEQAALQARLGQTANGDWRVRLRLAPNATYLYKAADPGILAPLTASDGVIFPYTPSITTSYNANYDTTDLTHSNYRGQFYKNSNTGDVSLTGAFTAQDTTEAAYMLAVIHFFRSVTKMFYGQDAERGAPPPLVYLSGFGPYQFNGHPCVVKSFNYTLPTDVDYVRVQPNNYGVNLLNRRVKQSNAPANTISSVVGRLSHAVDLLGNILKKGALPGGGGSNPSGQPGVAQQAVYNTSNATYVPTKIEIQLTLLPIQTRNQVSQQFGLKDYANGALLRGGFW